MGSYIIKGIQYTLAYTSTAAAVYLLRYLLFSSITRLSLSLSSAAVLLLFRFFFFLPNPISCISCHFLLYATVLIFLLFVLNNFLVGDRFFPLVSRRLKPEKKETNKQNKNKKQTNIVVR